MLRRPSSRQWRCAARPTRKPTPAATAKVTSGRCSTSLASRRNASFPSFAASLPNLMASPPTERVPPRNRSPISLNAEATASPTRSAACTAVAEVRPPTRSSCFSSDRSRRSISVRSAAIAREYPDWRNIARRSSVGALEPSVDLALGFVLGNAVALLQAAGELGALALDHIEVIVGELSPLLPNLAFELLPVSFNAIPVHRSLLLLISKDGGKTRRGELGSGTRRTPKKHGRSRHSPTTSEICRPSTGRGKWAAGRHDNACPGTSFPRRPNGKLGRPPPAPRNGG